MLASGLLNSCDTAARKFCWRRRSSASCRSVRVSTAMPPISTTRKKPPSQRIRFTRASLSSATAGSLPAKRCSTLRAYRTPSYIHQPTVATEIDSKAKKPICINWVGSRLTVMDSAPSCSRRLRLQARERDPQAFGQPVDVAARVRQRQERDLERRRRERDALVEQRVEDARVDLGRVRVERLGRARRLARVPGDPEHRPQTHERRVERRFRERARQLLLEISAERLETLPAVFSLQHAQRRE